MSAVSSGPDVNSLPAPHVPLQAQSAVWGWRSENISGSLLGSADRVPRERLRRKEGLACFSSSASCCLRFLGAAPQQSFFTLEAAVPSRSREAMAEPGVQFIQHVQNEVHQATASPCPPKSGGSPQGPSLQAQRHLCQLSSTSSEACDSSPHGDSFELLILIIPTLPFVSSALG